MSNYNNSLSNDRLENTIEILQSQNNHGDGWDDILFDKSDNILFRTWAIVDYSYVALRLFRPLYFYERLYIGKHWIDNIEFIKNRLNRIPDDTKNVIGYLYNNPINKEEENILIDMALNSFLKSCPSYNGQKSTLREFLCYNYGSNFINEKDMINKIIHLSPRSNSNSRNSPVQVHDYRSDYEYFIRCLVSRVATIRRFSSKKWSKILMCNCFMRGHLNDITNDYNNSLFDTPSNNLLANGSSIKIFPLTSKIVGQINGLMGNNLFSSVFKDISGVNAYDILLKKNETENNNRNNTFNFNNTGLYQTISRSPFDDSNILPEAVNVIDFDGQRISLTQTQTQRIPLDQPQTQNNSRNRLTISLSPNKTALSQKEMRKMLLEKLYDIKKCIPDFYIHDGFVYRNKESNRIDMDNLDDPVCNEINEYMKIREENAHIENVEENIDDIPQEVLYDIEESPNLVDIIGSNMF